ncbi:hypothetical protein B0F88_11658 [Methylobacter tundripaludum]|uniref:Uncharacterized protein n=1 Tax=Methylobacter tundripaludum TaxID=173365 RepID=A0A2S6GMY9_9GAMM|nr:hypothetical protein B0F88_11658 [Methylobacter tundripaludum]
MPYPILQRVSIILVFKLLLTSVIKLKAQRSKKMIRRQPDEFIDNAMRKK